MFCEYILKSLNNYMTFQLMRVKNKNKNLFIVSKRSEVLYILFDQQTELFYNNNNHFYYIIEQIRKTTPIDII